MKRALHRFIVSALFIPVLARSQDSAFTIKGNLLQPSSITSLLIFYPPTHFDSVKIKPGGSFCYSGNISEPGEMEIATKSSAISIWLDTGLTALHLSEKPNRNGKVVLTVDSVVGTPDTYLYYYSLLPKETITKTIKPAVPRSFYS